MRYLILLGVAASCIGCAAPSRAPAGYLPANAGAAVHDVRGGWASLRLFDTTTVEGELLATGPDSVFVFNAGTITAIPHADIRRGQIEVHRGDRAFPTAVMALGTLSTLSHGGFLILTVPMWLIGGGLAVRAGGRVGFRNYPTESWQELAPYARFPQGIPPGVGVEQLHRRA